MLVPAAEGGQCTTGGAGTASGACGPVTQPEEKARQDASKGVAEAAPSSVGLTRTSKLKRGDGAMRGGGGSLRSPSSCVKHRWPPWRRGDSAMSPSHESTMTSPSGPLSTRFLTAGISGSSSQLSPRRAHMNSWRFPPPKSALSAMRDFSPGSAFMSPKLSPAGGPVTPSLMLSSGGASDLKVYIHAPSG
nr:uncharacterized protein LOC129386651 [Dermacentor andersoni]